MNWKSRGRRVEGEKKKKGVATQNEGEDAGAVENQMDVEAKREARLGSVPDTPVMLFPAICVLANANDQKSWLGIAFEMLSASLLFSDCFFSL